MDQEIISEFVKEATDKYGRGEDTRTNRCATGDAIDTIALPYRGAIKPEGDAYKTYSTKAMAWSAFSNAFNDYMSTRSGPIYWRSEPTIDKIFSFDGFKASTRKFKDTFDGYVVHCRIFSPIQTVN